MSKKLILAIALSLVLASGGLFNAQAACGLSPCGWHLPSLCGLNLNPCGWHFPSCGCNSAKVAPRQDMNMLDESKVPQNESQATF